MFAVGPAGTGKTYLSARVAAQMLREGEIDAIYISRVTVSKKKHEQGFLPGKLEQKLAPWMRPIMDAFRAEMSGADLDKLMQNKQIEFASFEHMRGRTFENAFVILDEAQNTTPAQMKMFLTRLGEGSRMVVTGDPRQTDLPPGVESGLVRAVDRLSAVAEIAVTRFDRGDIVRHPLVSVILEAFEDDGETDGGRPGSQ